MSRHNTAALLAALLCIAAIGLAAATVAAPLDDDEFTRTLDEPDADAGNPFDFDFDSDSDWTESESEATGHWEFTSRCVPFLLTPAFYVLYLGAFAGLFAGVRRRLASEHAFAAVAFLIPITLFWHGTFTSACGEETWKADFGLPEGTVMNDTVSQATKTVSPETGTPILGLAVAGAFLLLVVAALVTTARQQSTGVGGDQAAPEPTSAHDIEGVARVAGEAADRIEGGEADHENAVFRAWKDMTTHLDLGNARTASPAEFRAAALDAGMSRDHVETLTDLFRAVRYGGEEPTADREERAVDALRAIEDAYGGAE